MKDNAAIWRFERWARLRSHLPPEVAGIPALRRSDGAAPTAASHSEKADVLAAKFFPTPEIDVSDISGDALDGRWNKGAFTLRRSVVEADIKKVVLETKLWKAPGDDWLFTGFLKQ